MAVLGTVMALALLVEQVELVVLEIQAAGIQVVGIQAAGMTEVDKRVAGNQKVDSSEEGIVIERFLVEGSRVEAEGNLADSRREGI